MELSIVASFYRSAPYLREFHRRASDAARQLGLDYEIVLVNDGSPDESLAVALGLQRDDPRLSVIDLSRNFGHHKAMMTGLAYARGARVFLIDVDLEEEPELLGSFVAAMDASEADIVYGVQQVRKGGLVERATGAVYYRLFDWLAAHHLPRNQLCARLMTRRFLDALLAHRDRDVFLAGLCVTTGFRQVEIPAYKHSKGTTTYPFGRRIRMAIDSIVSFSSRPLEGIFYLGTVLLAAAAVAASLLVGRHLFGGQILPGWASVMVALCFLGGLNLFCIGIVGIYLAKVFNEAKDRPFTVIRHVYTQVEPGEELRDRPLLAAAERR
jgi:putative glycosyltransferase